MADESRKKQSFRIGVLPGVVTVVITVVLLAFALSRDSEALLQSSATAPTACQEEWYTGFYAAVVREGWAEFWFPLDRKRVYEWPVCKDRAGRQDRDRISCDHRWQARIDAEGKTYRIGLDILTRPGDTRRAESIEWILDNYEPTVVNETDDAQISRSEDLSARLSGDSLVIRIERASIAQTLFGSSKPKRARFQTIHLDRPEFDTAKVEVDYDGSTRGQDQDANQAPAEVVQKEADQFWTGQPPGHFPSERANRAARRLRRDAPASCADVQALLHRYGGFLRSAKHEAHELGRVRRPRPGIVEYDHPPVNALSGVVLWLQTLERDCCQRLGQPQRDPE